LVGLGLAMWRWIFARFLAALLFALLPPNAPKRACGSNAESNRFDEAKGSGKKSASRNRLLHSLCKSDKDQRQTRLVRGLLQEWIDSSKKAIGDFLHLIGWSRCCKLISAEKSVATHPLLARR
jgi:hypothetical protein